VREELSAVFSHAEAHRGLALLIALDLYPGLWLGAPGEPGPSGSALRELEALPGCVLELRQLDAAAADGVRGLPARFSALFRNLPDPGGALARFRDAGYLLRKAADEVAVLLSWEALPNTDLSQRRFLHRAGDLWGTAACALGARAVARGELDVWRSALPSLVELVRREGAVLLDPPRLINGAEVQELLGLPPGPGVGQALAAVLAAQVEGRIRTREEAVELVRSLRMPPPA
jgi:hypothetical protein